MSCVCKHHDNEDGEHPQHRKKVATSYFCFLLFTNQCERKITLNALLI